MPARRRNPTGDPCYYSDRLQAYQIEYARPFNNWRSAHGQETPEGGKVRREVTQGLEQDSIEEKDREAIGQARREAQCKTHGTPCGTAPRYGPAQCTAPHGTTSPGHGASRRARIA